MHTHMHKNALVREVEGERESPFPRGCDVLGHNSMSVSSLACSCRNKEANLFTNCYYILSKLKTKQQVLVTSLSQAIGRSRLKAASP